MTSTLARNAAAILLLVCSTAVAACGRGDRAGAADGPGAGNEAVAAQAAPAPAADLAASADTASAAAPATAPAALDTLAFVNDDPITTADLDAMVMATHATMDMRRLGAQGARRLLDKAINDRLILQEAEAMGMDEDPDIAARLRRALAGHAMRAYVQRAYARPETVPPARVRAHFDRYYGKVRLRQLSLRTEAEAMAALAAVRAGGDLDSLAQAGSLDPWRAHGGLHNLKPWADVEEVLRAEVRGLPAGSYSRIFPLREAFSFLRVEQVLPPDPAELPKYEATIRARELAALRQEAWEKFLNDLAAKTPVTRDEAVLRTVAADSARVVHAEFKRGSERPALVLTTQAGEKMIADERALRETVSHVAMAGGGESFAALMVRGVAQARQDLLLEAAAAAQGWLTDPEVLARYERDRRQALLESYLEQVVMPKIVFRREEIRQYWEGHQEDFRAPEEVKLATFLIEDAAIAKEAAARLAGGADFEFVRSRYGGGEESPEAKWSQPHGFADPIREAIAKLTPEHPTTAVETPSGWLLLKLEGRRPGQVRPVEESEMQIREALFQDRFKDIMDEHLNTLKQRSRIVTREARIARYFGDQG